MIRSLRTGDELRLPRVSFMFPNRAAEPVGGVWYPVSGTGDAEPTAEPCQHPVAEDAGRDALRTFPPLAIHSRIGYRSVNGDKDELGLPLFRGAVRG